MTTNSRRSSPSTTGRPMSGGAASKRQEDHAHWAENALAAAAKARSLHGEGSVTGALMLRVARAHARLAGGEVREVKP